MSKETYYFSHDYDPISDPKLSALVGEFGALGYGIYWRVIELLHSDSDHVLKRKPYVFAAIAKQMSTSVEQIENVLKYATDICELFHQNDDCFWSDRVLRNINKRLEISDLRSKAGKASADKRKNATRVQHELTCVQQNATKERKEKEKKEENKEEVLMSDAIATDYNLLNLNKFDPTSKRDIGIFEMAKTVFELIKYNEKYLDVTWVNLKKTKAQKFYNDIRNAVDLDQRTHKDFESVNIFLKEHHFWASQIRSSDTYRGKMDTMLGQAQSALKTPLKSKIDKTTLRSTPANEMTL